MTFQLCFFSLNFLEDEKNNSLQVFVMSWYILLLYRKRIQSTHNVSGWPWALLPEDKKIPFFRANSGIPNEFSGYTLKLQEKTVRPVVKSSMHTKPSRIIFRDEISRRGIQTYLEPVRYEKILFSRMSMIFVLFYMALPLTEL